MRESIHDYVLAVLPSHCTPTYPFLEKISTYFGTCIPTPLAGLSILCGCLSLLSWLGAQMPQIIKNYRIKSTAGLSIYFLVEWLLGDATNLTGAILTHQAGWQKVVASYYVTVDVILTLQHFWYSHVRSKFYDGSVHSIDSDDADAASDMINSLSPINTNFGEEEDGTVKNDEPTENTAPSATPIKTPQFSTVNYEKSKDLAHSFKLNATWLSQASPKAVFIAAATSNLIAQAAAAPTYKATVTRQMTTAEYVGTLISWSSTFLYLVSRLPQIYKNWKRQSTAGLSPLLFFAAFCGNFFYTLSMLTNPSAWRTYGPYGHHGWVGPDGSKRAAWILNAAPFFLGAFGCLGLDITIGIQFVLYGEGVDKLVKVRDGYGHSHWERVSGWMRGWIPSVAREKVVDLAESQRLLAESREMRRSQHSGYGAL